MDEPPSEEEVLASVSALICQFLEVAVHCLLFARGVYPPEIFERRRMYGVAVHQSRHKELNDYIANSIAAAREWMRKGLVESVVVSIDDVTTGKQLERFVFEVALDLTGQHEQLDIGMGSSKAKRVSTTAHDPQQLEDAFRQVLLKIVVCESLLKPLGRETKFCIYVHTRESVKDARDEWETMQEEEGGIASAETEEALSYIQPLKNVQAGVVKLQLFAQLPWSGRV